jgi:hypothetical protein
MRIINFLLAMLSWSLAVLSDTISYITADPLFNVATGILILLGFGYLILTLLGKYDGQSKR